MMRDYRHTCAGIVRWGLFCLLVAVPVCRCRAEEQAEAFLAALRDHGMYNMALVYLGRAADDPLVSADFKERVTYEEGVTLLQQASSIADPKIQEKKLQQAEEKLESFVNGSKASVLNASAHSQLGDLLMARGRTLVARAAREPSRTASEIEQNRRQSRESFDRARDSFEATEKFYSAALKSLPPIVQKSESNAADSSARRGRTIAAAARQAQEKRRATRLEYHSELAQSRLMAATALYEKALTFPEKSKDRKKLLDEAAKKHNELFEKYRRFPAGLYARLGEGQCYRDLNQLDKAIGCFEDIVLQDAESPALRSLISKAHRLRAECYMQQKDYDKVIDDCELWLKDARGAENRDPEWLGVQYQLALAYEAKAAAAEKAGERSQNGRSARRLLREVGRWPSPWQEQAAEQFVQLVADTSDDIALSFDEELDAGERAIETMGSLQMAVKLAAKNNPDGVPEMKKQIGEQREAAFDHLQRAVQLANEHSDPDKVARALSYFAYLNYELERYFDAAVLGEQAARRYPETASGRRGAQIAMGAYQKLYLAWKDEDGEFASKRLTDMARYVLDRWPEESEGETALQLLVDTALREDDLAAARGYAEKIPAARRAPVTVRIGLAEWSRYVRSMQLDKEDRPSQEELSSMKKRAQTDLEEGVAQLAKDAQITDTIATAVLSLAQIYLDTSQPAKAIERLEDERFGPLTLLSQKSPAASSPAFAEETYKVALRAYVSVQPPQREKALQIMDAMEEQARRTGGAEAEETITQIYISLGQKLQSYLERLTAEGNVVEVQRVSDAFVDFLDRVSSRQAGNTWASRNWIAQTYYTLAAGSDKNKKSAQRTRAFYQKAADAYQQIVDQAAKDPSFAPSPDAVLSAKLRLAECLRRSGQFGEALKLFVEVLGARPNALSAQVSAAYTFQERGSEENPKWYRAARLGAYKDKKTNENRIWGWARIAQITYRYPKYRDVYFEAQYNSALCRFAYALKQQGESRSTELAKVERELKSMDTLWSGGEWTKWRPKYERLLKKVEQARQGSNG